MQFEPKPFSENNSEHLTAILASKTELTLRRKSHITFHDPIIYQDDTPIIFPQTITLIQGKSGVHKSRVAETICSAVLKHKDCRNPLLGFRANPRETYTVCYVDTERNLKDQFPFALQQIIRKAGYGIEDEMPNFDYVSLLGLERKERFQALKSYIEHVRTHYNTHILIVLDIITDCLMNFNDSSESMELIDLMNRTINSNNVTFICLIHENPGAGTEKARGHLGTELMNKATTHIQVGFEKDNTQENTDIVKIKFMKLRVGKRPDSIYACYSETEKGLVIADPLRVSELSDSRRKAPKDQVIKELTILLTGPMPKNELFAHIKQDLNCSERTLEDRLREILQNKEPIRNMQGTICYLSKQTEHRQVFYSLVPVDASPTLDLPESEA